MDCTRVVATVQHLDVPKDLKMLFDRLARAPPTRAAVLNETVTKFHGPYEQKPFGHAMPIDLEEYPFEKFVERNFRVGPSCRCL